MNYDSVAKRSLIAAGPLNGLINVSKG